jgi:hypothetical protein
MIFERRNFLKTGTAGLAAGLVNPASALAQTSATASSGELEGGTESVRLQGRLKSGVLEIEARDFVEGKDRTLVVRGKFNSINLYSAMFSYNHDRTVFALLRDHDHSTTLVLSDTEDPKIGRLSVWNDAEAPETFRVDKEKVFDTENLKESILDGKGSSLDLVGKRKPPVFSPEELEMVFGDNPGLREFMRGKRSTHHPRPEQKLNAWICHFLSNVPGSLFGVPWAAY